MIGFDYAIIYNILVRRIFWIFCENTYLLFLSFSENIVIAILGLHFTHNPTILQEFIALSSGKYSGIKIFPSTKIDS